MRTAESEDDIYNSLPVECFTYGSKHSWSTAAHYLELEDEGPEGRVSSTDSMPSVLSDTETISGGPDHSLAPSVMQLARQLAKEDSLFMPAPNHVHAEEDPTHLLESFNRLSVSPPEMPAPLTTSMRHATTTPVEEDHGMWIRCTRCGKKNEIDCNFCGKCGLQIHRVVNIVEAQTDAAQSPEVARNIKYHYKRPVFCFGPHGMLVRR